MADIVLGLTKSVVEATVSEVKSAIEENKQLKERVKHDLVFITGEFQMMQSFLNAVDREQVVKNNVVRTWVRQVRDLAYDVEDSIEFVIHLDDKPDWCYRVYASYASYCCWCCPSMVPALPLDEAVADLKQLKARVEDVSNRNMRYNVIADPAGSKPGAADDDEHVARRQHKPPPALAAGATSFDILVEARETARKQPGLGDLTQLITREGGGELRVISLWGTAGDLGITTIIKKAYHDGDIRRSFGCRGWVKLARPFDPHSLLHDLLAQFRANSGQTAAAAAVQGGGAGTYIDEFTSLVNDQRYLVVLEDVSTMVELDAMRRYLTDMNNGSRIIVSTQKFEIASMCTGHPYLTWELKQFSVDHSVCVLYNERITLASKRNMAQQWLAGNKVSGRRKETHASFDLLNVETTHYRVISVWGISGVGKSAFVRRSYLSRIMRRDQLTTRYGWVDVPHPFNLRDLSRSLLFDLCPEFRQAEEREGFGMSGIKDPIEQCHQVLCKHKCLIVIDGLRSTEEWDLIKDKLVNGRSASSIIVITNEASVAKHCAVPSKAVLNLRCLEAGKAFELFKKKVFEAPENGNRVLDAGMMEKAESIVNKCGGIPKVIVEVAGYLGQKAEDEGAWSNLAYDSFMHELETNPWFDKLRGLFDWTNFYFRTCPDFLKPCIFYLSIFHWNPAPIIRRRRLVRRWLAEGYARDGDSNSAEEIGEEFCAMLVDLSIIQQPPPRTTCARTVAFQVNGFFREYIYSRPMEYNFVFALEGPCSRTTQRTGRHLVIGSNWNRDDKVVFDSIDFSRLRSLTVFGEWRRFFVSAKMKLLRVLDLEGTTGDVTCEDVKQLVQLLRRLKFLSLRGCTMIHCLPECLGDLRQLQTLDVRGTTIVKLPSSITNLEKLQYVRAGAVGSLLTPLRGRPRTSLAVGVHVPAKINDLMALHTLGVINVSASANQGKAILEGLKKLTQLRKLGVSGINKRNMQRFISVILSLRYLESLSVWLSEHNEQDCLKLDGILQAQQSQVQPQQSQPQANAQAQVQQTQLQPQQAQPQVHTQQAHAQPKTDALQAQVQQTQQQQKQAQPQAQSQTQQQAQSQPQLQQTRQHVHTQQVQPQPQTQLAQTQAHAQVPQANTQQAQVQHTQPQPQQAQPQSQTQAQQHVQSQQLLQQAQKHIHTQQAQPQPHTQQAQSPQAQAQSPQASTQQAQPQPHTQQAQSPQAQAQSPQASTQQAQVQHTQLQPQQAQPQAQTHAQQQAQLQPQLQQAQPQPQVRAQQAPLAQPAPLVQPQAQSQQAQPQQAQPQTQAQQPQTRQPPEKLRSLKLYYSHVDTLPAWIKQLNNLKKLDLGMILLTQEDMHFLGDLRLCVLGICIKPIQDDQLSFSVRHEEDENNSSFKCLEELKITCNSRLKHIVFGPRVMQLLVSLKISCCSGSMLLQFSGLENLGISGSLKEVSVEGSYDNIILENLRTQISKCRKKPVLNCKNHAHSS